MSVDRTSVTTTTLVSLTTSARAYAFDHRADAATWVGGRTAVAARGRCSGSSLVWSSVVTSIAIAAPLTVVFGFRRARCSTPARRGAEAPLPPSIGSKPFHYVCRDRLLGYSSV